MPRPDCEKHRGQFAANLFYRCDDPEHRSSPSSALAPILPPIVTSLMAPFQSFFTTPVWEHVLVLVIGMVLAPGKRTVSAALRVMGLGATRDRRIAVAGRTERQHLPDLLPGIAQKISEGVRLRAQFADAVGPGKGSGMQQDSAGSWEAHAVSE